ncbi:hypothetical protein GCM10017667_67080 [Streptomyces filamentosus]|uniref:Uncharacterized protein n=1 Tax=Streptomyces filamentosus TaxID=67294 RepID=A0A919BUY0_STRFL|nr:hypothetical protein GCM10017667_67080 [Streptomyces filamentosus]
MRGVPVGERVAGVGEVAAEDAEVLVGEVAQPPGGVRVGRLAEPVMEVSAVATSTSPRAVTMPS